MQIMGAFEAKTHFSSLLEQVEQGEEFLITRHGHPIARLVTVKQSTHKNKHDVIARLKVLRKKNTLNGLDWKLLRDEGRR